MIDSDLLDQERALIFLHTQGSVYLPLIGIVFWPSLGIAGYFLSAQVWCLSVLAIFAALLPISIVVLSVLLKKISSKSPLATLMWPALLPVFMSFGFTLTVYFSDLSLVPVAFVLGLALHWPVFAWLYNQPVYGVHFVLRTVMAVSFWFFFPQHVYTLLPIFVGVLYLITAWWLIRNSRLVKMAGTAK